jgi:hypothetical protein
MRHLNMRRGVLRLEIRPGIAAAVLALLFAASGTLIAQCTGPGAPTNTETRCVTAISVGTLTSFDISWVDPERSLYFLADRDNKGVDIISTATNTLIGRANGFVGISPQGRNHSGPDGVVSHGRWLYAGDGDSKLQVFDISDPTNPKFIKKISTGGTTRLDELALSDDGELLLGANNAEDPPFATLFAANGDNASDSTFIIKGHIEADNTIIPQGFGLSIEQPAWDEERVGDGNEPEGHHGLFYASIPTIANNPMGCNYGQNHGQAITCSGGLMVLDPADPDHPHVVPLNECGPNGLTVGPHDNLLAGCTPGNEPSNTSELVINADSLNLNAQQAFRSGYYANIGGITGSDEVWFDGGDNRYYTASNNHFDGPVLGVINATTNLLVETIPQSGGSHSVAADSRRNFIYVPQGADVAGSASAGICGSTNGCIAVYTYISRTE